MGKRIFCPGFTLIELMTVIAVIAILIALLMPTFAKAREAANSVVCQSNLRQITLAVLGYANDNRGLFPAAGVFSLEHGADWVHWQAGRDIRESAIARYFGGGFVRTLTCPSDERLAQPRVLTDAYPFSYSFNFSFSQTYFGEVCKLGRIRRSTDKILIVCEDEWSLDDSNWDGRLVSQTNENVLSNRHMRPRNTSWYSVQSLLAPFRPDRNQTGNVAFADGHADVIPRWVTWDSTSYDALK